MAGVNVSAERALTVARRKFRALHTTQGLQYLRARNQGARATAADPRTLRFPPVRTVAIGTVTAGCVRIWTFSQGYSV